MVGQCAPELQQFGTITSMPNGLEATRVGPVVDYLNQLLADTMTLRDLYKKHHWQVDGPAFYQLHLLFDKHYDEPVELVDLLAERIQVLGGLSIPDPARLLKELQLSVNSSEALSSDELVILCLLAAGRSNKGMAAAADIESVRRVACARPTRSLKHAHPKDVGQVVMR
jgi:DNA-binding ferritin-like protein